MKIYNFCVKMFVEFWSRSHLRKTLQKIWCDHLLIIQTIKNDSLNYLLSLINNWISKEKFHGMECKNIEKLQFVVFSYRLEIYYSEPKSEFYFIIICEESFNQK